MSVKAKENAKKTLFHFFKPNKIKEEYNTLPLEHYNFGIQKDRAKRPSTKIRPLLVGENLSVFDKAVGDMKKPEAKIEDLRQ